MSAQIDFHQGCEPAQIVAFAFAHEKRGLREIVLAGDGLHLIVRKPFLQRTDCGGITRENLARESVYLINANAGLTHVRKLSFLL